MTKYGILVDMNKVYKKLDEKIKELNSSRVYKKITPMHDLSWYVKWTASFFILTAVAARSVGTIPLIDLWFSLVGTLGWLWVGMLWHDRALILLNSVAIFIFSSGILNYYYGQ